MNKLLTKAFEKAGKLPHEIQDEIAKNLLEDIEGETRWDQTLEKSHDKLAKLSDMALKEFKAGKTKKMGFDEL
tara:strand:+ start:294 stop:512 length:219 start_codon:yes stop_codon:yes gene_type:complete